MSEARDLDVSLCRAQRPYSRTEYIGRICWAAISPLFFLSPRPMFGWRRFLLRLFGATVGRNANVYPSAKIYLPWNLSLGAEASIGEWALIYNLGKVQIGPQATISHRAHLCAGTHDYSDPALPLLRESIEIGPQAWICADAFIGPNVKVGAGAVVGARSVLVRDIPDWAVVAGNPAKVIKTRKLREASEQ
jgi:putative colanic acid biosynthesis acetyltransferase WcaF